MEQLAAEVPADIEPRFQFTWRHMLQGAMTSLVLHLLMLISLGLFTVGAKLAPFQLSVIEVAAEPEHSVELATLPPEAFSASEVLGEDGSSAAAGPIDPHADAFQPPLESEIPAPEIGPPARPAGLEGTGLGEEGVGHGKQGKGTSRFFGLKVRGNSFVYVVDCSGSMGDDRKYERACTELLESITSLDSNQEYFIIFYNDNAYPMDADKPIEATSKNIEATRIWMSRFTPYSDTRPLSALLYALSLQPDAIYFLSDGQFDPMVLDELRKQSELHSRRIPIHTIAFSSLEGESLMRTIARQSGGKFRFVK